MSTTTLLKKLREVLGVENNTEVLGAVQVLQQRPVALAVSWTPGTPDLKAVISVLGGQQVPFPVLSATLRAGLAVLDWQMSQRAAQLQQLLQQEKARQDEPKE